VTEVGGRQLVIGPSSIMGIDITRKIFSPAAGGFARYLDILSNSSAAPVTLTVGQEMFLESFDDTRLLLAPQDTGNTYLVASEAFSCCDNPNVAEVFAGSGAAVPINNIQFRNSNSDITYQWNTVTIQPGQTMIFMHFAVQHDPNDNAGLEAQAASLANLSDPNALTGMTDAEKAAVVNFSIPTGTSALPQSKGNTAVAWNAEKGKFNLPSCTQDFGFVPVQWPSACDWEFSVPVLTGSAESVISTPAGQSGTASISGGDLL
jgi:hypothetical protein